MNNFNQAEQVCIGWNMDLATFENQDEFDAIFEILSKQICF